MKTSKKVENKTNRYFCYRGGCILDIMKISLEECAILCKTQPVPILDRDGFSDRQSIRPAKLCNRLS